jgi:hypothetical protein
VNNIDPEKQPGARAEADSKPIPPQTNKCLENRGQESQQSNPSAGIPVAEALRDNKPSNESLLIGADTAKLPQNQKRNILGRLMKYGRIAGAIAGIATGAKINSDTGNIFGSAPAVFCVIGIVGGTILGFILFLCWQLVALLEKKTGIKASVLSKWQAGAGAVLLVALIGIFVGFWDRSPVRIVILEKNAKHSDRLEIIFNIENHGDSPIPLHHFGVLFAFNRWGSVNVISGRHQAI